MNIKDIPKNTHENLQTIEHKTTSSPAPENDIDPIELLETMDGYINILMGEPADEDIQRILSELKSMEILTMTNGSKHWWMNEPIVLHQYVMKRSMGARITHLFKSKGEWKSEYRKEDDLEVKARVQLPLHIAIRPEWSKEIKNNEIPPLLLSVVGLRNTIEIMLEDGATSSGVFLKPDGVIHMNKIRTWLEGNEKRGSWSMKDDLDTKTLFDVIEETGLDTSL
jgi:hypothetical protein